MIEILSELNEKEIKEGFTQLAIDNIKRGDTFYSSVIFIRKILNTYPLDSQVRFKTGSSVATVSVILQEIFKKVDLFDLILQNVNDYLKLAHQQKIIRQQKL